MPVTSVLLQGEHADEYPRTFICIEYSTYGNSGLITQSPTRESRLDRRAHGLAIYRLLKVTWYGKKDSLERLTC